MRPNLHAVEDVALPNGHRLLHVRTDLPVAVVSLWFPFGGRQDLPGKEGIAHLMEHLLFKTTTDLPTVAAARVDHAARGIDYSATTYAERMSFTYQVAADDAVAAARRLVEVLQTMRVDPARTEAEKSIVADERNRKATPQLLMVPRMAEALFPGSGLDHHSLGTAESVAGITHEESMAFADRYVIAARKTFVVCSPFSADAFTEAFAGIAAAGSAPAAVRPAAPVRPVPLRVMPGTGPNVHVGVCYGVYGCDDAVEDAAVSLLVGAYLAGSRSSRLQARLREERQFTYDVAGFLDRFTDRAAAKFRYSVEKAKLAESLRVFEEEVEKVRRGEVDPALLAVAKKEMRLRLLKRSMSPDDVASWYAADAVHGLPIETMDDRCALYEALEPQHLADAARKHLIRERRSLVLFGDVTEEAARNWAQ